MTVLKELLRMPKATFAMVLAELVANAEVAGGVVERRLE